MWMPFGVVSEVGRGTGVLDVSGDHRREVAVLRVNVGHPIVTNGDFVAYIVIFCREGGYAAFLQLLMDFLLTTSTARV